jgi:NOL1/NOP2/sun family putative RNA methylase
MGKLPSIKPNFEKHYKELLSLRYDEFRDILFIPLRKSIRINTLKKERKEFLLKNELKLEQIPWCEDGFFVLEKPRKGLGNSIGHQLGYFYIQEAASMIPALVLNPKPGELILDMCAAPGSKTTQIASLMKNKGLIIANDYKGKRLSSLGMNLNRCGVTNSIITLMFGHTISTFNRFDRILLDAPCSATGAIRKALKVLDMWNINGIKRLAGTQRQLILTAFNLLKPGGTLVYSTCSVEPEENEAVINHLLERFPNAKLEDIKLNIKRSSPFLQYDNRTFNPEIKKVLRIWPQDNNTEGFFVAKIKKT